MRAEPTELSARRSRHCHASVQRVRMWAEQEMRPFVDLIERVRLLEKPSYLLTESGLEKISDGLEEPERRIIAQCEECISYIMEQAEKMMLSAERLP